MNLQRKGRNLSRCLSLIILSGYCSTFAWKIPWTEEPGRLQSMGSLESDTTEQLHFHFPLSCVGEGNGSPLQCSCLENPRDGGAWWATVHGVAELDTTERLHSLSLLLYNTVLVLPYIDMNQSRVYMSSQIALRNIFRN